jgi:HK97 family phage prohead protease
MEFKRINLDLKADGDGFAVSGYGSVFDEVDSYGDRIVKGAFAETLTKRNPKMLWQHRMDQPIGVWDTVVEDSKGLRMTGRLADTMRGREARELVKMGAMDGLSIGYRTSADEMEGDIRILKAIDLYEVSFVTIPAAASATVTGIKSEMTERGFETLLIEQGFSRSAAKTIVATGFKGYLDKLRDAAEGDPQQHLRDADELKASIETLLQNAGRSNV